jgi:hypothetical protein
VRDIETEVERERDSELESISIATLRELLSPRELRSLIKGLGDSNRKILIPNFELLRPGDLILTKERESQHRFRIRRSGSRKPNRITRAQLDGGIPSEKATWTHVAVYVGNLHIVESTGVKDLARNKWRRLGNWRVGVKCNSLLKYSENHDISVLRYRGDDAGQLGMKVAFHALLDVSLGRRRYDYGRAFYLALPEQIRNWLGPNIVNRVKRIICSDLALEYYHQGGKELVDLAYEVQLGKKVIFPASFACDSRFEVVNISYFMLER